MSSVNKRKRSNTRVKSYRKKPKGTQKAKRKTPMKRRSNKKRTIKRVKVLTPSDMQLFKFSIPGPKPMKNLSKEGRVSYTDTHAETFTGQTGVQGVFYGKCVGTQAQITGAPNIVKNSRTNTTAPYMTLDPNRSTTGSLETSGTVPVPKFPVLTTPDSQSIYGMHHRCAMSLTNFSSIACHVEVRWTMCKKTAGSDPIVCWETDMSLMRLGQVAASIPGGVASVPLTGYPIPEFYGEDPEANANWKKYWKVLKKSEFILPAGTTIRFEFNRPVNKLFRKNDVVQEADNFIRGFTFVPVFIFKPSPVDAYLTADTVATRIVNTGTCKIGYMQTDTLTFCFPKQKSNAANVAFTANIKNTFANMNQSHIDDDDDVQAVAEA